MEDAGWLDVEVDDEPLPAAMPAPTAATPPPISSSRVLMADPPVASTVPLARSIVTFVPCLNRNAPSRRRLHFWSSGGASWPAETRCTTFRPSSHCTT